MKILFATTHIPDLEKEQTMLPEDIHGVIFPTHKQYVSSNTIPFRQYPLFFEQNVRNMTREGIQEYIHQFYKTFAYLILKEGYTHIRVQHGLYIGYAASLIKEKMGIPYEIILHNKQMSQLCEFADPVLGMKAIIDADKVYAHSEGQKNRLLNLYTKECIIDYEIRQSGLSPLEASQRYKIHIGDRKLRHLVVEVQYYSDFFLIAQSV